MIPVIDSSAWQANSAFNSTTGTLAPGWTSPVFAPAVARGVRGVIARCSIGNIVDPYYQPTIQAARQAPFVGAAYHWNKPYLFSTFTEVDTVHRACELAPPDFFMADIEDQKIAWTGRQFLDWVFDFMGRVDVDRKVIYTGFPYWSQRVTPDVAAQYAAEFARYDLMIASYPHQRPAPAGTDANVWAAQKWPVVPTAVNWFEWAQTDQIAPDGSLDDGRLPSIPPGWDSYDGWQMSSHAKARDYGFASGASLDCNVVKDDAWARWVAPPTIPEVPVSQKIPYGYYAAMDTPAVIRTKSPQYTWIDPELWRRLVAFCLASAVEAPDEVIGPGGGGRTYAQQAKNYAQDPQRFASPDLSYHVPCTPNATVLAIDMVQINPGGAHKAPPKGGWAHRNAARFGLVFNVAKESWHMQPIDTPSSKRGYNQNPAKYYPLKTWPLGPLAPEIPTTPDEDEDEDMYTLHEVLGADGASTGSIFAWNGGRYVGVPGSAFLDAGAALGHYKTMPGEPISWADHQTLLQWHGVNATQPG